MADIEYVSVAIQLLPKILPMDDSKNTYPNPTEPKQALPEKHHMWDILYL